MRKKPSELDFEEYIRQVEPAKREKSYAWSTAIGLQQVDGLTTSDYLLRQEKYRGKDFPEQGASAY